MKKVYSEKYKMFSNEIEDCISRFNDTGDLIYGGERNAIKTFDVETLKLNIKAFKKPNIFNRIIYRFFRKSKAQRSFEFAQRLGDLKMGTPEPIAYFENSSTWSFDSSYYVSLHVNYTITYRELLTDLEYPNHEAILRAFTRFTYNLHQNNINFLDHSPGNTLIEIDNDTYKFYLVDLNRMTFGPMSLKERIQNFSKLTIYKDMVKVMSDEYAKISGDNYDRIFNLMWQSTESFQKKYHRKRRLKNKLLFWRAPRN